MKKIRYTVLSGCDVEISNIVIDSREARKGSLFFCLRGLKSDGHNFLPAVIEAGAAAAIVDRDGDYGSKITILKVEDSRKALAVAAANFYDNPSDGLNLIGITGTKGKTSTSYFCEAILSENSRKTGLIGTVGTNASGEKINIAFATSTTPDPIELQKILRAMRDRGVTDIAMEVSSHALAFDKVFGTRFAVAVFTNLTQDHLDFHKDMQSYLEAKTKLFKMCDVGIVNADSDACGYIMKNADCPIVTYGINRKCDIWARNVRLMMEGLSFDVELDDKIWTFDADMGGRFTVYNLLGAIGAARAIGIPVEDIQSAFRKLNGVPGRMQKVPNNFGFRVIVDYAHSPDSLKNILEAVREFTKGRVITVFGCGGDKDREKRPIMGRIAGDLSDYCVVTSDNPRTENPDAIIDEVEPGVREANCAYGRVVERREAIQHAIWMAEPGDSVIIAGKGHEDYQIFADRTIHFDDCNEAAMALERYMREHKTSNI